MFIARISKGRTIRQFVIFVILVPSLVSFVWFSIMGGAAFDLQLEAGRRHAGARSRAGWRTRCSTRSASSPSLGLTIGLAIFLIAIFFVTGADSASIVMGMLSEHGEEEPRRWLVVFWGVAMGCVAALLLWQGGLEALQRLVIIVAGPFMLVLIAMCVSLMKALREEPDISLIPPQERKLAREYLVTRSERPTPPPSRDRRRRGRDSDLTRRGCP